MVVKLWSNVTSHRTIKFGVHGAYRIGEKTFFICHVTTHDHVIKESHEFLSTDPFSQAVTVPSLVAIGSRIKSHLFVIN